MSQTIGGVSYKDSSLELSVDGTVWTPHMGTYHELDVAGGEFPTDDVHTADGLPPIVTEGKPSSFKISITSVYTEIALEAQALVQAAYTARTPLYARWTAKGITVGNKSYTTTAGKVTTNPYPKGNVGEAKAILTKWDLVCANVVPGLMA